MKNYQRTVSAWLEEPGKERNLPLVLEQDGHCTIPCAVDLNCIIEVPGDMEPGAVFIYLPLMQLPEQTTAQITLINKAMQMNLFGLLTGGAHLGLDTRTNCIVLSFSSPVDALDATLFKHVLNDMLEIAPNLQRQLQAVTNPESTIDQVAESNHAFSKQAHLNRLNNTGKSAHRS